MEMLWVVLEDSPITAYKNPQKIPHSKDSYQCLQIPF
jgi:hypothetical protein